MSGTKPLLDAGVTTLSAAPADVGEATLEQLMDQYIDGSAAAFDELYRRVAPKVLSYLLRMSKHRDRAEDLLQVTFAKVHRARDSYISGAPVLPWVLAIARRSFFDERRAARVRQEELSSDGSIPEPKSEQDGIPADLSEALDRALDRMPPAYREAIQLTKITGLSMNEAADVLGTTAAALKLRVHRGYEQLRRELEVYGRK